MEFKVIALAFISLTITTGDRNGMRYIVAMGSCEALALRIWDESYHHTVLFSKDIHSCGLPLEKFFVSQ